MKNINWVKQIWIHLPVGKPRSLLDLSNPFHLLYTEWCAPLYMSFNFIPQVYIGYMRNLLMADRTSIYNYSFLWENNILRTHYSILSVIVLMMPIISCIKFRFVSWMTVYYAVHSYLCNCLNHSSTVIFSVSRQGESCFTWWNVPNPHMVWCVSCLVHIMNYSML